MIIYKYKKFIEEKEIPHFYEIILKKIIWAAQPSTLNDKDHEFRHKINCMQSQNTRDLLSQTFKRQGKNFPNTEAGPLVPGLLPVRFLAPRRVWARFPFPLGRWSHRHRG